MVDAHHGAEGHDEPDVGGADGEDAAEEDGEEIGVEAAREADQHHGEGEAAGEEDRQGGVALERPAGAEALHAERARHGHHEGAKDRRDARRRGPSATPASATWARRVGDEREPPRHQEHADGRADDGGHGARHEGALHEAEVEELGHGTLPQWSWRDDAHRGAVERGEGGVAQEVAGAAVEDEPPVQAGELA